MYQFNISTYSKPSSYYVCVCVYKYVCLLHEIMFFALVEDEDSVTDASMLTIIALLYFDCFIAFMCHHAFAFVYSYS